VIPEITAIGISLASLHLPYSGQNQFNPGIHLEAENYRAGFYRNSNNGNGMPATTSYVGYSLPIYSTKTVRIGLNVALDYGYRSPVIGGIELRLGDNVVVMAGPGVKADSSTIFGFGLRFPIK
jgi:hypothetical protein